MTKILIFILLSILASCSQQALNVDHHIPTTAGLTPESSGKLLAGSIEFGAHSAHKLNLIQSTQSSLFGHVSNTFIDTNKSYDSSGGMSIKGSLGLFNIIDYVIQRSTESPTLHGVKLQILGSSFKARQKGFKLAVAALYGEGVDTETGKFSISIQDSGVDEFDNVSGDVLMKQRQAALLFGYRFTDFFLLFGSATYIHVDSKATLYVNSVPNHVLAESEYFTGAIGARINSTSSSVNTFAQTEIGRSKGHIFRGTSQTTDAFDFSFGITW